METHCLTAEGPPGSQGTAPVPVPTSLTRFRSLRVLPSARSSQCLRVEAAIVGVSCFDLFQGYSVLHF